MVIVVTVVVVAVMVMVALVKVVVVAVMVVMVVTVTVMVVVMVLVPVEPFNGTLKEMSGILKGTSKYCRDQIPKESTDYILMVSLRKSMAS